MASKQIKQFNLHEIYQVGEFIDARDNQGDWRVGYILEINQVAKTFKIRFDGWAAKYDQYFRFGPHKLSEFRSIVIGYTGQNQNPATRPSWKFSINQVQNHMFYSQYYIDGSIQNKIKTAHQFNQFFRGRNYFYTDFLMTLTYQRTEDLKTVFEYFKTICLLVVSYLKNISSNLSKFIENISFSSNRQFLINLEAAHHCSYYQIFDMLKIITGTYKRFQGFFKDNEELLKKQLEKEGVDFNHSKTYLKLAYQKKLFQIFINAQGLDYIQSILKKILEQNTYLIPFSFVTCLATLINNFSMLIPSKTKESFIHLFMKVAQKSLQQLGDKQMKDFNSYQAMSFVHQIAQICSRTQFEKNIEIWSKSMYLQIYFKMITCQYFEKKLKGIALIAEHIQTKQDLIFDKSISKWLEQKKVLEILLSNDNPQLIKKTTQLIKYFYSKDNQLEKYILLVWRYCQGKHETVLKEIYSFIGQVPSYNKNESFIQYLFKKNVGTYQQNQWDIEYIKMIRDFTFNALCTWSRKSPLQLYGLNIIYEYLKKNQDKNNIYLLLDVFIKIQDDKYLVNFAQSCLLCLQNKSSIRFHTSLFLKLLKQRIFDLKNFRIKASSIIQKSLISIKNLPEDDATLQEHFQLLPEVLKQIKQVIPLEEFVLLWEQMTNSKGRVHFFKLLYKIKQTGRVQLTNLINNQTKQYILKTFWTEQYLRNHSEVDESQAIFLLELFKVINQMPINIVRSGLIMEVKEQNLIGLEKLYSVYESSSNSKACSILAKGLAEIYMSGSIELQQKQVDLTYNFVTQIADRMKTYLQHLSMGGIKKQLTLLEEIILRDQEIFEVNNYTRVCLLKDYIIKITDSGDQKSVRFNSLQTFYNFKKSLGQKLGLSLHKFDLLGPNEQKISLRDYFKSLNELRILEKIKLVKRPSQHSKVKNQLNKHLQLLFELLGNRQIQQRVWSIVSKLPISEDLRIKIKQNSNPLTVLENSSFYKQLYMFKVTTSLDKWWGNSVEQTINFFSMKLTRISATTQIQRQYLMVTMKILEQIAQNQDIKNFDIAQSIFESSYKMIKKLMTETREIQVLNLTTIKRTIQTFLNIAERLQKVKYLENQSNIYSLMFEDKQVGEFFKLCLISYPHQKIRKQFSSRLSKIITLNKDRFWRQFHNLIFNELLNFSVEFENKNNLREYILFSNNVLQKIYPILLENDLSETNQELFKKLMKLIQNQPQQISTETVNVSLWCYIHLMRYVVHQVIGFQLDKLFRYIYHDCLFNGKQSKCKSKQSKQAIFNLLGKMIKNDKIQNRIISSFSQLHRNGSWRTRKLEDWIINQSQRIKSATGYTGLKNLGCICYMNSFFQQIFMIEQFRLPLLFCQDPSYNPDEISNNILYQVKKMFINLLYSDKKDYNPKSFCMSFKDSEGNSTNVEEQMDIDQFSGILFDRLENSMKGTKFANLVKQTFGGVFSNQIICKGCPHFSSTQQQFLSLSLTVKDKKSIYESLQTMIKGDVLDGENAYFCQRCNKKVSAVKRVCLKSLPDHLIVTLKRFQFDYMTMTKHKINEYCEFSEQLNLEPFSYEYLRKKQNPNAFQGQQTLKNNAYYEYRLKGVVIHYGYADNGHYYSLIQQRDSTQQKWFEFNDSIVRKFNFQNLDEEAFGGSSSGNDSKQRIRNAYMLIYERVEKINKLNPEILKNKHSIQHLDIYKKIFQTINQGNVETNKENILFSLEYTKFLTNLIEEAGRNRNNLELQKFIILIFLTVSTRSKVQPGFFETFQKLHSNISIKNPELNQWILQQFCDLKIYEQFFRSNPVTELKKILLFWLLQIFKQSQNQNLKINFLRVIFYKLTVECENTIQPIIILYYLARDRRYAEFMIENNLIGRLLENVSRIQNRQFGIDNFKLLQFEQNYLGYEQIVQRSTFQTKKLKYNNQSGYVWGLIYRLISKYNQQQLAMVLSSKQILYILLNQERIYKLLEQVKNKFEIDMVTDYLAYLSYENFDFSKDLVLLIEKGLKQFPSKKYRQFFVLFQKLIRISDSMSQQRTSWIHNVMKGLKQNQKYLIDCTIIQFWLCKIINENQDLRSYLIKEQSILQELSDLAMKKLPSQDVARKNTNYGQNSVNMLHGIPFPSSRKAYTKILKLVEQFYQKLRSNNFDHLNLFQSGNHIVDQSLSVGDKIAYFDTKEKLAFQQITIHGIFLHKLNITRNNKQFWIWQQDERLTSNLKVIKNQDDHDLDSSKTTEMDDYI